MLRTLYNIFYYCYDLVRSYFEYEDYHIHNSCFVFKVDIIADKEDVHELWEEVPTDEGEYYYDITDSFRKTKGECVELLTKNVPPDVDFQYTEITFDYKNKTYTWITPKNNISWPPLISREMKFNIPIVKVELIDSNGEIMRDVTSRFVRCAGPHNDFFNEKVPIAWVVEYDEAFMEDDNIKIRITNTLNQYIMKTPRDIITSQYWEQDKIQSYQD